MLTSDFDFDFPEPQIALRPLPRGEARLMVVSASGSLPADFPLPVEPEGWAFGQAKDLVRILRPGDMLALNDTKVLRARLHGKLDTGGSVEVLLLKPRGNGGDTWECMAKPGKKLQPRRGVFFGGDASSGSNAKLSAEVLEILPEGERVLRFSIGGADFYEALEGIGQIPLPPYIRREADAADAETYQTVFAAHPGSVAAPTASLHLSESMLAELAARNIGSAKLTLHVGAGTFRPVQTERAEDHPMHSETYVLPEASAAALNAARKAGGRLIAVGTTASRVVETRADANGLLSPGAGDTDIFIHPGYEWKAVDALLTNFHWPKSTLFMLVASKLGTERAKAAYAEAIRRGFRLFSYGDGMLIL
ncbi:MAG TPA: tRNA preQ1(34) S-adenosylmethionine ribosyltransferase-isomerase QueA [Fibrobacteria bacterium]|nr:tRNA preQ1(34) S-adenosylmethionine ribosyltransferase-isomerase QueA [Fibrobacteria bacterium]